MVLTRSVKSLSRYVSYHEASFMIHNVLLVEGSRARETENCQSVQPFMATFTKFAKLFSAAFTEFAEIPER